MRIMFLVNIPCLYVFLFVFPESMYFLCSNTFSCTKYFCNKWLEIQWPFLVSCNCQPDFIRPLCLSKRSPFQSFPTLTNLSFLYKKKSSAAIIIVVVCIKISSVFSLFGAHRQPPCHFLVENITMENKNYAEPGKAMIRGPFPNFWLLSFLARNVPNSKAKPRASPAFCL